MVLIMPVSPPENGLLYTANNIKLKLGDKVVGEGTIYIAQNTLSWQPSDLAEGISIEWKQVSLHGISSNPRKCIYFMLDHKVEWSGVYGDPPQPAVNGQNRGGPDAEVDEGNGSDEHEEDDNFEDAVDEQFEEVTECWLLPDDIHTVDTMYSAMTTCQALHPDSADSDSDDSDPMQDAGGLDDDAMEEEDALTLGRNGVQNLSLDDDDERFEDADE
ncbi:methylosome subunit pICln [Drosophila ficusphila]|uniref:methylosome subunit pICln n=1 Tax=Drosophila ficusphila TaxID=30025 RepID=UPI0007E5F490|nr:methylosome subunit pICln [Drosophila ficusphila]